MEAMSALKTPELGFLFTVSSEEERLVLAVLHVAWFRSSVGANANQVRPTFWKTCSLIQGQRYVLRHSHGVSILLGGHCQYGEHQSVISSSLPVKGKLYH